MEVDYCVRLRSRFTLDTDSRVCIRVNTRRGKKEELGDEIFKSVRLTFVNYS